jgi:peptide/nickel transport system substrate-binding protein
MVVAASTDPGHFNSAITTAGGTHFVAANLYNGLVFLDEKLDPKPDLAESWTVGDGGRTYTFKLRPGVKWHDGVDFSSADVKFSFEQVLLKYHARTKAGLESALAGIDTPDATTVVFRFKQPYGPLLQRLDVVEAPIVAKHVYEGKDPTTADANLKPVGTGPFKLAEYVKSDRVRMSRNESYFKPGLPYLDELVFRIIPQASTQSLALERGEIDYLSGVAGPDLARLQASGNVTLAASGAGSGGSFCINTLIYNLSRPPLDKVGVRQALAHAIDRQQILEQVNFGQGRVAVSAIASTIPWAHNPNVTKYPLDRAQAERLLDSSGAPKTADGTRFSVEFVHATSFAKVGELMKEHLAPLGIDLKLSALEVNAANDRTFIRKDFDIGIASYCNGPDPEIGVRRVYVSSNIGPILFSNGAGYRNARVDELFDKAAASVDRAERGKLYGEIQEILAKDVPYWWLVETEGQRAWTKALRGITYWSGNLAEGAWRD